MSEHRSYRQQSRDINWGSTGEGSLTLDQINCGSLLRIADAVEKMASSYDSLREDRDFYRQLYLDERAAAKKLARGNAALRGHLKRLKRLKPLKRRRAAP